MRGGKRENSGRPLGSANKTTKEVREIFKNLLCENENKIQELFNQVAKENPAKALELIIKITQLVTPKPTSSDEPMSAWTWQ